MTASKLYDYLRDCTARGRTEDRSLLIEQILDPDQAKLRGLSCVRSKAPWHAQTPGPG